MIFRHQIQGWNLPRLQEAQTLLVKAGAEDMPPPLATCQERLDSMRADVRDELTRRESGV